MEMTSAPDTSPPGAVSLPIDAEASAVSPAKANAIIAVLAFTGVIAAGMQTLIVPLIGQLPTILGASASDTAWSVTATLLASAVSIPVVGRLGDMVGKRRMLVLSLLPLIAGSVMCALAASLGPMIIGRGLQGLGMGVIPLGISLLREVLPARRVGSAVATMGASMGIGGAVALPLAAAIADYASWRGMFWAFGGFAVLALCVILILVPRGASSPRKESFDILGAILLAAALVSLLLAIAQGPTWGWGSSRIIGLFLAFGFVTAFWVAQQLRVEHPLVNLRSLAARPVAITNLASLLIGFAMYAQALVIPQLLQLPEQTGYGLGQSMLGMALWLVPGGLTMMLVSPVGARLTAWRGAKVTLVAGALIVALGYGAALLFSGAPWSLMIAVMIINVGVGFAYGAIPMLVMGSVPATETASANAFNTLVRSVGTSAAAALIGVVLAAFSSDMGGHVVPELAGFQLTLVIGGGAAVVAAAVALFLPGRARTES